jgi:hypothetical protein
MSEFSALIDDLNSVLAAEEETLAKAMKPDADDAADDAKIKAAADGDADDDGESDSEDAIDDHDEPDGDEGEDGEGDGDGDEAPLTKAFSVTLPNGEEAEAIDGNELIKSFTGQLQALRTEQEQAMKQMAEALSRSTKLIKSLREQNETLASRVRVLGQSGRGRKSALNVHERPMVGDEHLSKADSVTPMSLMAKALTAQKAGRLTGTQVAEIDAYVARGLSIPETLLARLGD